MTPDLVIIEANQAYLTNTGRSREDLIGPPILETFPPTEDASTTTAPLVFRHRWGNTLRGMPRVLVLNGPNLGRLGSRQPEVYGHATHEDLVDACKRQGESVGLDVEVRQSDDEADVVRWLHEAVDTETHVVLNPAAFTHYSYAVRDACTLVTGAGLTLVEVHLSNPAAREEFRHTSVVAGVATGTVAGFGLDSYRLALRAVAERVQRSDDA